MWTPGWARKGSRLDRWYLGSPWHRVFVDSALIALMSFALALVDHRNVGFAMGAGVLAATFSLLLIGSWTLVRLRSTKRI